MNLTGEEIFNKILPELTPYIAAFIIAMFGFAISVVAGAAAWVRSLSRTKSVERNLLLESKARQAHEEKLTVQDRVDLKEFLFKQLSEIKQEQREDARKYRQLEEKFAKLLEENNKLKYYIFVLKSENSELKNSLKKLQDGINKTTTSKI